MCTRRNRIIRTYKKAAVSERKASRDFPGMREMRKKKWELCKKFRASTGDF